MMPKIISAAGITLIFSAPLLATAQVQVQSTTTTTTTSTDASASLAKLLKEPPKLTAGQMAQKESQRRSTLLSRSRQSIADGDRALNLGNFDAAATDYQDALDSVTESGKSEGLYDRAAHSLAQAKSGQAATAAKDNKFAQAADLLKQAVVLDPNNPTYPAQIEQLKQEQEVYEENVRDPEGVTVNPAVTDEFKDRVAVAQKLLFQGEAYFRTGQYALAEETYSKILLIDPYNKAAREQMTHIEKYRQRAAGERHDLEEQTQILRQDQGWETKVSPDIVIKEKHDTGTAEVSNRAKIAEKLDNIRLDHVSFSRADVAYVIQFLNGKTRDLDPTHEGVNFVLRLTANALPPPPPTPGAAPAGVALPPPAPTIHREVSVNLEDITVRQFLNIVEQQTQLNFSIDDYAVYLRPSVDEGEFLNVRTFQAPPGLFDGSALSAAPDTGAGGLPGVGAPPKVGVDVKAILTSKGIPFPGESSAVYLSTSSKLVVKNTSENLDLIATLIDQLSQETPEVQIEAKIAEFNQTAIKGFTPNYFLSFGKSFSNAGYGPTVTGPLQASTALRSSFYAPIVNGGLQQNSIDALVQANLVNNGQGPITYLWNGEDQTQNTPTSLFLGATVDRRGLGVILNLINNLTGVSLLSAPIVTTENNQEAKIAIAEEFPYPTAFTQPKLPGGDLGYTINTITRTILGPVVAQVNDAVTLGIPSTPSSFKTENLGVIMDVTPTTYPDQRIDLKISQAEVEDFDGFIDYGEPIVGRFSPTDPDENLPGTVITPSVINQPVFNVRSLSTVLQVIDGQTAILGGLTREDTQEINDKIPVFGDLPFVGRAFQSRVSQRVKKNLIFFITANLVRPNGRPQYMKTLSAEPDETVLPPDLGPALTIPAATDGSGS